MANKEFDKTNNVEVMNFDNVRCYQDDNNTLQYKTRDVARELGYEYTKVYKNITATSGGNYQNNDIRWNRINNNLNRLGYDSLTEEQKNGYIPENLVYKLGFHGRTQKAIDFQNLVSDKILPYYRDNVSLEEHNRMRQELEDTKKQLVETDHKLDIAVDEIIQHQRAANKYNKALGVMNQQKQFWHEKTEELSAARNSDQKTIEELEYKLDLYRNAIRGIINEDDDL